MDVGCDPLRTSLEVSFDLRQKRSGFIAKRDSDRCGAFAQIHDRQRARPRFDRSRDGKEKLAGTLRHWRNDARIVVCVSDLRSKDSETSSGPQSDETFERRSVRIAEGEGNHFLQVDDAQAGDLDSALGGQDT